MDIGRILRGRRLLAPQKLINDGLFVDSQRFLQGMEVLSVVVEQLLDEAGVFEVEGFGGHGIYDL